MACRIWSDHEWREQLAGSGSHPTRGSYLLYRLTCESCGKTRTEMRFVELRPAYIGHLYEANRSES